MYCIAKTQTTNHKDDLREHIFYKILPVKQEVKSTCIYVADYVSLEMDVSGFVPL